MKRLNKIYLSFFILLLSNTIYAQWSTDFINYQKSFPKVNSAINKRLDTLMEKCSQKGIGWPLQEVYLRCFKLDKKIELWVKDGLNPKFQLFDTYKVCGVSGKPGPKRKEGDRQIPEGFYFINHFNPNSNYHLSLGINYPNVSDKILADATKPGGDIYIHGDCVSVGCFAITDEKIEDLYIASSVAKSSGQEYIPVHIFPGVFSNAKSRVKIQKLADEQADYIPFIKSMQSVYYHFEKEKQILPILINSKGQYVIQEVQIPVEISRSEDVAVLRKKIKTTHHKERTYKEDEIFNEVTSFPVFDGGSKAYQDFVKNVSEELVYYLDENQKKAFVYTSFIVNTDGTISNVEVKKGGTDVLNDQLITKLENTKNWTPASKDGISVPFKMSQTFFIESIPSGPAAQ